VPILAPEDIAAAVEWLVSDKAKYVTGIALPVDDSPSAEPASHTKKQRHR
jgi:hypothetical protein